MKKQPIHILMVEDDPNDFELVANELKNADRRFEIRRVDSFEQLDEEMPRLAPDLVLCDHVSARWDSFAVLDQVRAFEPNMPFVVLSGGLDPQTREELDARGVDGCVGKDRITELPQVVREVLRSHEEKQRERVREIRESLLAARHRRRKAVPAFAT